MRGYMKSRTFWLLALSAFAALSIVSVGIFVYSWQTDISDNLNAARRENAEAANTISRYLDDMLEDAVVLAKKLQTTEWVQKLCVEQNVFDDAFDYVRRREVAADYLFYVGQSGVVTRRFLVYPGKDIAIGEDVFTDVYSYLGIIGTPAVRRAELLAEIRAATDMTLLRGGGKDYVRGSLVLCLPVEEINRSRAFLCCFLNKGRLMDDIEALMPNGIVGMSVSDASGEPILRLGRCEESASVNRTERGARYIDWRYDYYADTGVATVVYSRGERNILGSVLCALALCLLTAYALAVALYRPVAKLMDRAGLKRAEARGVTNDYQALGEHIDRMTERYNQSRRMALLNRLLSGYFNRDEVALDAMDAPFSEDAYYKVLLCEEKSDLKGNAQGRNAMRAEMDRFFRERGIRCETLDSMDAALVAIAAFPSEEDARMLPVVALNRLLAGRYAVFVGASARGLVGISISYQSAKEKYHHLSGAAASRYYFPLEWENQLLDALFSGRSAVAEGILTEMRRENDRRAEAGQMSGTDSYRLFGALVGDVRRVLNEARWPDECLAERLSALAGKEDSAEIWSDLSAICATLCEQVAAGCGDESGEAKRVVAYIDEHASDHELTLTALGEAFGVSANTVNKYIKQVSGLTFHAYLTQRRNERAKALLADGRWRIAQVAQMVGYDTEYSFRRAFARYTGVKAQDFASGKSADVKIEE